MKVVKLDDIIEYCEAQVPHLLASSQTVALAHLRYLKNFVISESFDIREELEKSEKECYNEVGEI